MCTYVRRFNNRNETHQGSCSCDPELRDSSCYDKQGATENLNKPQPQAPLSEHIWTKNMILHHCCFPWWWKCEVFFPLLLGTLNLLVPHPLEKTVHNKAWGLAANFWDFAAKNSVHNKAWGLAANFWDFAAKNSPLSIALAISALVPRACGLRLSSPNIGLRCPCLSGWLPNIHYATL